jgi:hypothetical protein
LVIYSEDCKSTYKRDTCTPMENLLRCLDKWIKQMWYMYTMELLSHKE